MLAAGSLAVLRVRLFGQVLCPDSYVNPPTNQDTKTGLGDPPRRRQGSVVAYRNDLNGARDSFELLRKAVGEPEGWFRGPSDRVSVEGSDPNRKVEK